MKMLVAGITIMLCCLAGKVDANDNSLPLAKRVSIEKLLLTEKYQAAVQKCREHKRKSARHSCNEQEKERILKAIEELEDDPKAYFIAKESKSLDEKDLQEARKQVSSGKGY